MLKIIKSIKSDINTVFKRDPAARTPLEVFLSYPGLHALWLHRIAHFLYLKKEFVTARLISHLARFLSGIEIHPGAVVGKRFFIDHGSGVVIGETARIGDDCLVYQGVVLGGTSTKKEKRHPTLGNNVIIGAGAVVLGPVKIEDNARIGSGAVVVTDVPAGATAVGIPAKIGLGFSGRDITALEHGKLPDPVADAVKYVISEQDKIEERVKTLENLEGVKSHIDRVMEEKKKEILREFSGISEKDEFSSGGGI
ncbi:MAG: serine O-acetyltransferase [Elusimicrobiota bacterium]